MLDMLPLYLHIKKDAMLSALRLSTTKHFKPGDLVGHLSILKEIPWDPMAITMSDAMPTKLNFDLPFKVHIPDREIWDKGGPEYLNQSLNWYTDASKLNGKTGVGVYGPKCKARKALGQHPTVYQGEVYAILFCAQLNLKKGLNKAHINIMSDSQAAVKALSSFTFESKLTWECLDTLKLLARNNYVTLTWPLITPHMIQYRELLTKKGLNLK
jgi:RNase H.